jgi:hypothetical protein
MRWKGHVARIEESRNAYRALVGNLREGDYLEDRRRWEDNIKTDLQEVGWGHGLD